MWSMTIGILGLESSSTRSSHSSPAAWIRACQPYSLMRAIGDVGRVQSKAGTQAALDALKIAQGPRDLSRMARLAEAKGTRTRAILRTLGRSAIFLTTGAFSLFSWLFTAVMTVLGFFAAVKAELRAARPRRPSSSHEG